MNRPEEEPLETSQLTTVLNRLRPTVVVRRRVYEVAREQVAVVSHMATDAGFEEEDDESGPPSSVNVARALANLRADELHRLEEILSAQDEQDEQERVAVAEAALTQPAEPAIPTVRVGPAIALPELARRMSVPTQELVTALVTRGFFSVTFKSTLPRETARAAAWMFGWLVEDDDDDVMAAAPAQAKAKAPAKAAAAKAKVPVAKAPAKAAAAKTKVATKTSSAKKKR